MLAKINAAQAKKNAERRQIIARNKKRKRANPEASGALNPFVRRDTWSTGMVIARETKEDEEFNAKENKLKEKKPKSEKDDQAQEEKKVYMIDQILKKAVQLPHNVTSADMKESDQTRKFVEEDESWRKMRELCTVRQLNIDVASEYVAPREPEPIRSRLPEGAKRISLSEYLAMLPED
mmetsp:Transcript_34458/g.67132  ORF Transcript_34458/g.67132 Transcript_34458/m.67132 type:complete len:179 (-) Transcript_34458:166-702(-)